MSSARLVPWADWAEWARVRDGLLGNVLLGDSAATSAALTRVQTWRARGRVPLAVDATAQLVELRLHDPGVTGSPGVRRNKKESNAPHATTSEKCPRMVETRDGLFVFLISLRRSSTCRGGAS